MASAFFLSAAFVYTSESLLLKSSCVCADPVIANRKNRLAKANRFKRMGFIVCRYKGSLQDKILHLPEKFNGRTLTGGAISFFQSRPYAGAITSYCSSHQCCC